MRYPTVPLITVDPFFCIHSFSDKINDETTRHWTGAPHGIFGYVYIDGKKLCLISNTWEHEECIKQISVEVEALSTHYVFESEEIRVKLKFTTPLLLNELMVMSRPVSYLEIHGEVIDGKAHEISFEICVEDEIALNWKGEYPTEYFPVHFASGISCGKVGSRIQNPLVSCGDNHRINYGYLYLATRDGVVEDRKGKFRNLLETHTLCAKTKGGIIAFAYDDIKALSYFNSPVDGYYKKDGDTVEIAIEKALNEYDAIIKRCDSFAKELYNRSKEVGGENYATLTAISYRQAISAHKLCLDTEGNIIFISKENFSNGCAATVDVTMPSAPLFLLYNPDLLEGMLRPIFKYADTKEWIYNFAPHDAGVYPLVNGQAYSEGIDPRWQMPVEECGNMLILMYSLALSKKNADFAFENWSNLNKWADYLVENTFSSEKQLCTDDFAGHLANNANLAIKAILGITAFSRLLKWKGESVLADKYLKTAKDYAAQWIKKARNTDGTFMLAFGQEGTFSLKYNLYWDYVWGTNIFDKSLFDAELNGYFKKMKRYGVPLDNRADYTKSDWLVWVACLYKTKKDFNRIVTPLLKAYSESKSRVPLTDWYDTKNAKQIGFQARSVVGGHFAKLLLDSQICKEQN